jgi:hypothetical protein
VTSHLPHLIAYTIVGTATDLEDSLKSEVIESPASGFRDFTRIAASDPVMWRDIFLNNREAVLEILQRFNEDLTALQRAIGWDEGDKFQDLFTRTRAIRQHDRPIRRDDDSRSTSEDRAAGLSRCLKLWGYRPGVCASPASRRPPPPVPAQLGRR